MLVWPSALCFCCCSGAFGTSIGTRDLAAPDLESQFTPTHLAPGQGVVVIAASAAGAARRRRSSPLRSPAVAEPDHLAAVDGVDLNAG